MGGRRFEGLSCITRVSFRRGSVWVDLLNRFKVRILGDCSGMTPGTESHSVISDAFSWSAWLTAFLDGEKKTATQTRVREKILITQSLATVLTLNIYTLFDGLVYNTHGYFASCVVFFRAPKGRGKIRAMSKMPASIIC